MDGADGLVFRFLDWIFGAVATITTIISSFVLWLMNNANLKIDKQKDAIDAIWKAHNNFRVEVSNEYVKSHTIERVYDTLDEIKDDIKLLLQRK